MPVRLFTLQEANRMIPTLEPLLSALQSLNGELAGLREQLVDLRIVWGDQVLKPDCPDYEEWRDYQAKFDAKEKEIAQRSEEVARLGCEVKDAEIGLIDFYAARGEDVVYLCWRRGEPEIRHWHTLSDGFTGRQSIDTF